MQAKVKKLTVRERIMLGFLLVVLLWILGELLVNTP
jgi:hypothetical protein